MADKVRLLRLNPRQKITWNCHNSTMFIAGAVLRFPNSNCHHFHNLFSGVGITGGVHRLWAHRSYKATFPLRVYLMLSNSIANQGDLSKPHQITHRRHSLVDFILEKGVHTLSSTETEPLLTPYQLHSN